MTRARRRCGVGNVDRERAKTSTNVCNDGLGVANSDFSSAVGIENDSLATLVLCGAGSTHTVALEAETVPSDV